MDDDNQLSQTNEKELLMTNFDGLVTAASTEYLFLLHFIHF